MNLRFGATLLVVGLMLLATRPAAADTPCDAVAKALRSVNSYEATLLFRNGGKVALQGTTDIEKPNRVHVVEPKIEMIGIGSKSWMRMNGGAWQSSPIALGSVASMDPSSFAKPKGTSTCVDAGMGMWHGQPTHIYKYAYSGAKGNSGHGTMYVGTDGLVRHIDLQSTATSGSIDFSKFNTVNINPP